MRLLLSAWKLRSSQTGLLNITISSLHSNGIHSYQLSQSNRATLWCGWAGDSFIIDVLLMNQQWLEPAIIWALVWPVSMERNLSGMFPATCWSWRQYGVQSSTSNVCLIKWCICLIQLSNCLICNIAQLTDEALHIKLHSCTDSLQALTSRFFSIMLHYWFGALLCLSFRLLGSRMKWFMWCS